MKYTIYTQSTGQIQRIIDCSPGLIDMQLLDGEVYVDGSPDFGGAGYISAGQFVAVGNAPGPHHVFDFAAKQWVDPRSLLQLKADQWVAIKAARDAAEFGGFTWDGSTFDSDLTSQSRIQGAVQLAGLDPANFSLDWTLADNSVRTLSAAQMTAVGAALGVHVAAQHALGRTLRSQIEAATTAAEVDAVAWPA